LRKQIVEHDLIAHFHRQFRIGPQLRNQLVQLVRAKRRAIVQVSVNQ
jgi:hypothetical protein